MSRYEDCGLRFLGYYSQRVKGIEIKGCYERGRNWLRLITSRFGFRMPKTRLGVPDGLQGRACNLHRQHLSLAAGSQCADRRMRAEGGRRNSFIPHPSAFIAPVVGQVEIRPEFALIPWRSLISHARRRIRKGRPWRCNASLTKWLSLAG